MSADPETNSTAQSAPSPAPSWHLHLDDEGYPIMDGGIRGDDSEFLQMVFRNLHRLDDSDRGPLATRMDDKKVVVTSFDDPLIAQSVKLQGESTRWNFLGGLEFQCPVKEILVDNWQRLHAYLGPEKIPAVMSRKAQADFLLKLEKPEALKPGPYRHSTRKSDWPARYEQGDTPWNMQEINPLFLHHADRFIRESGLECFIPGAGHGHEIPYFISKGKRLTAYDLSPIAKNEFNRLYPAAKCRYVVGDFFTDSFPQFDGILENYFFVALEPELRAKTLKRIHSLLKPGGYYGGIFFMRSADGGPPYGLSEWELREHTNGLFDVLEWQRSPHSHPKRKFMEHWALFRKKS